MFRGSMGSPRATPREHARCSPTLTSRMFVWQPIPPVANILPGLGTRAALFEEKSYTGKVVRQGRGGELEHVAKVNVCMLQVNVSSGKLWLNSWPEVNVAAVDVKSSEKQKMKTPHTTLSVHVSRLPYGGRCCCRVCWRLRQVCSLPPRPLSELPLAWLAVYENAQNGIDAHSSLNPCI